LNNIEPYKEKTYVENKTLNINSTFCIINKPLANLNEDTKNEVEIDDYKYNVKSKNKNYLNSNFIRRDFNIISK